MTDYYVNLLGSLRILRTDRSAVSICSMKAQELFAFLILHREHSIRREALSSILWELSATCKAQKTLRQALWHLQSSLRNDSSDQESIVQCYDERMRINPDAEIEVDVNLVTRAFEEVRDIAGRDLTDGRVDTLRHAVSLYSGNLLEDWEYEWLTFERQHIQDMMVEMLSKLMLWCESRREYETGVDYGYHILNLDRAHERTHRYMMRMLYSMNDRTGATRQFDRCVAALEKDLDAQPGKATLSLYNQIKSEEFWDMEAEAPPVLHASMLDSSLSDLDCVIKEVRPILKAFLSQLEEQRLLS